MKWLTGAVLAALLSPLAVTVLVSLTRSSYLRLPHDGVTLAWYREFAANPVWLQALGNTLGVALLTVLIAVPAAMCAALAPVRQTPRHPMRWRLLWEGAILLPLALPSVALAAGMLAVVRVTPLWGSHLSLAFAHAVVAMPVAYLVLRGSLQQVDPNLEAAARGLGAGPWQVFRFVTLPLVMPAVLAATLFALVLSVNEVTLTLFLATRDTQTLPRVIWPNLRFALTPVVAAASVVLLALTLPAVVAAGWWLRPRRGNR